MESERKPEEKPEQPQPQRAEGWPTDRKPKSRIAAGVFGVLLGSLGIHRFYLGYTDIGIAQLVLTLLTGIGGWIWGLYDGIRILTGEFNQDAWGRPLVDPDYTKDYGDRKLRLTAGMLGVLLGWAGIHRFYMNYTGIGIIQIIVTLVTFGLGGLWGVIEGVLILTHSFKADADGRPLIDYEVSIPEEPRRAA